MQSKIFTGTLAVALAALFGLAHAGFDDLMKSAGGLLDSASHATGGGASSLSNAQISAGLKEALSLGAERAVAVLGRSGGFLDDGRVRIPLPGVLGSAAKGLRAAGQGQYVDEFETAINRAAEQAIPETLGIVQDTVRNMTLQDVQGILTGGDDAATRFLRERAGGSLRHAILPIVSRATDSAGATSAYKSLKAQADGMLGGLGGLVDTGSLDLDGYVTDKTMDGLFLKLAAEEKSIRTNPAAQTTDILKTVFSS
ncbi:MAG: DUF4197 domain-containing protein [Chromatiaceae bacterium]|jgi:hypothetical protein|nr:DUF4197 domain-containing protein [Chromatiaceae bacterium]